LKIKVKFFVLIINIFIDIDNFFYHFTLPGITIKLRDLFMNENEIIVVKNIPHENYYKITLDAVKYAIISIPFTIDRIGLRNRNKQIFNIAKGKLAEGLFKFFCKKNNIDANFDNCETPFYQIDKRDFLLGDSEWDQKNNFIYHSSDQLTSHLYTDLPALIPNRPNRKDQWQKRTDHCFKSTKSVKFLFTFMKATDKNNRRNNFFTINLSGKQLDFLEKLYNKYNGLPQNGKPFGINDFWEEMTYLKDDQISFRLIDEPNLVITAYSDSNHWNLFFDTKNKIFLDGILRTKIRNKTCYLKQLPSFLSLFPQLRERLKFGFIKQK